MKKVRPNGPYRILGYSFGAAIAYEIALQLESNPKDAGSTLILLDGSHAYMQTYRTMYRIAYQVSEDTVSSLRGSAE